MSVDIGYSTFGVKKGLPFTPFLNAEIIKLQSSGVMQQIMQRNALKKTICPKTKSFDGNDQIKFQKVVFPFSIILFGIVFSMVFLCVEYMK